MQDDFWLPLLGLPWFHKFWITYSLSTPSSRWPHITQYVTIWNDRETHLALSSHHPCKRLSIHPQIFPSLVCIFIIYNILFLYKIIHSNCMIFMARWCGWSVFLKDLHEVTVYRYVHNEHLYAHFKIIISITNKYQKFNSDTNDRHMTLMAGDVL